MLAVKKYLSLVKFSHTIFAMPFALIGFFLGMRNSVYEQNLIKQPYCIFGGIPKLAHLYLLSSA
jgi:4-hydroxybenzoate polyprenyltransferase